MKIVKEGIIIEIKVKANSNETRFDRGLLKLKAPPKNNKANKEMLNFLKKFFGKEVELVSGFRSREKTVLIRNSTTSEVEKAWRSLA